MFVNLDVSDGEWFPFQTSTVDVTSGETKFEDPDQNAKVQIRAMTPFFEARVSKRKRKVDNVFNAKSRQMERISYYEDLPFVEVQRERDDAYDYAITGLYGFKNEKTGEVIQCTRENKIALMKLPVFERFFSKCQQELASSGVKQEEELEKNLSTGLSSES